MKHAFATLAALLLCASVAHAGGALDRFEDPHTSDDDDDDDSSRSSDDDDDDGSYYSGNDWDPAYDTWESDDDGGEADPVDGSIALMALCMVPPLPFACLHPIHRSTVNPYAGSLYIEPFDSEREPAIGGEGTFLREDWRRARSGELRMSGFRAMNEDWILTHELDFTAFIYGLTLSASWEHFYEQLETGKFDHLDMARGHLGVNLLGPFVDRLELYFHTGASLLLKSDVTPAFDVGGELRLYPVYPLAIHAHTTFSVFELGPVLVDSRFELGVAIERFEVRAGPRLLQQGEAQGFWGPSGSVAVRF